MGANVTIQKNWQELIRPNKLQVAAGADAKREATVVAEPLERGFGLTLGNALRRILLVVAAGRRGDVGAYRRRAARVLVDPGRARGRHRHRAQHQGHRHQDAGRRPQAHGGEEAGARPGHRRRHPDRRRHRRAQSRPRAVHARRGRRDPHGVHGQHRQGLRADRPQPSRGRADRPHPGRQPVLAGAQGLLQGREHPRGPDPRLRQAHDADRDQRRGDAGRCGRLCRAHPAGPAQRVRELRGAAQGGRLRGDPGPRVQPGLPQEGGRARAVACAPPTV